MIRIGRPANGVLSLYMNRPERKNAVTLELVEMLIQAMTPGRTTSVIVLGGEGRSFSSGIDLDHGVLGAVSDRLYELYSVMVESRVPIVAAIRGHAIGAGAQLALASDLRVASPDLQMRFPGRDHGLALGTWGLPSLVGRGRAIDLCMTGRTVIAEEAFRIGLVDRVTEDPDAAALDLAKTLVERGDSQLGKIKSLIGHAVGLTGALRREAENNRFR